MSQLSPRCLNYVSVVLWLCLPAVALRGQSVSLMQGAAVKEALKLSHQQTSGLR